MDRGVSINCSLDHISYCFPLQNDEPADDGKQTTIENTKMNESIGSEDYSPSLSEVCS